MRSELYLRPSRVVRWGQHFGLIGFFRTTFLQHYSVFLNISGDAHVDFEVVRHVSRSGITQNHVVQWISNSYSKHSGLYYARVCHFYVFALQPFENYLCAPLDTSFILFSPFITLTLCCSTGQWVSEAHSHLSDERDHVVGKGISLRPQHHHSQINGRFM